MWFFMASKKRRPQSSMVSVDSLFMSPLLLAGKYTEMLDFESSFYLGGSSIALTLSSNKCGHYVKSHYLSKKFKMPYNCFAVIIIEQL